jgi:hypothetical protein
VALGRCFTAPAVGAGVRRASSEWLLHTFVLCSLRPFPFGSCLSAKLCMTTLRPHLHSSLSIAPQQCGVATCLGRWRLLASRLPPFLPASDPRLPDARQGRTLSLHHLEGKSFTYMNTQLSRYNTLAAHPPAFKTGFERTGRTHNVQPTSGILRDFWQFSTPQRNPAPKPSPHPPTCG